jgi:hypothetical protein
LSDKTIDNPKFRGRTQMASNVVQGSPIVLDLSPNGGGQLQLRNNTNDNKIFLEGFSRDGNGHASEMLITGNSAQRLPLFSVLADSTRLQGSPIVLDLSPNGGGQLQLRNNTNDNKIFLEGFSSDGNGHASEMLITGNSAQRLPLFSVLADTTRLLGDVEVTGDIRLTNADCAEDFDICDTEQIEPGTVMVLGEAGKLERSQKAYDKRVAGVVSGAAVTSPASCWTSSSLITSDNPLRCSAKSTAKSMRSMARLKWAIC